MEHGPAGASWDGQAASVRCLCGWASDPPTPVGPGWIEELETQFEVHMTEAP